ncbi:unnamed protein product [Rotaria sordida]|uniref:Uncharacterized protein n=1 Tax=Rotaria sordida TaxID=392033 RepID=A0A814HND4_9BILA|nr:unnamed protein product [Rotaria sordida]
MKFLICLFITLGVACGSILPLRPNCLHTFCTMDIKICPDGTRAPIPTGGCCPSLSACKPNIHPIKPITNCAFVMCTMDLKICPDGRPAPVPAGECCPSLSACNGPTISRRSNPLGSLLSGSNILQTLTSATHGTNLGTAISILNLLNNVHLLSSDVHQIPHLINQTLTSILNGTGQASQLIIDQLIGAVSSVTNQNSASRNLLGALGQNTNLLSSITHMLPQGTSISSILSILNLLNNVNQLNHDIHQIPALLNQTLASVVAGAGQAGDVIVQQLLSLVGPHSGTSRNLLGALGQNTNLLSSITHMLPQGTSISSILSILNLLNNVNQLNHDIHKIPTLLNETLAGLVNGAGQAGQLVVQQLLNLVGAQPQATGRNLLDSLGHNANLLSSVSHLLPQGTSISTVLSLLNLLGNVNALNTDLHQIPTVLQETLQSLLNGIQNLVPPTIQPVQGSS